MTQPIARKLVEARAVSSTRQRYQSWGKVSNSTMTRVWRAIQREKAGTRTQYGRALSKLLPSCSPGMMHGSSSVGTPSSSPPKSYQMAS